MSEQLSKRKTQSRQQNPKVYLAMLTFRHTLVLMCVYYACFFKQGEAARCLIVKQPAVPNAQSLRALKRQLLLNFVIWHICSKYAKANVIA